MLPNSDGEMNADTAIQYVAALGKQLTVQFSLCLAPVGRGTSSFMNQRLIEICSAIPPILSSQWQICDFLNRLSRLTETWQSSLPLGLLDSDQCVHFMYCTTSIGSSSPRMCPGSPARDLRLPGSNAAEAVKRNPAAKPIEASASRKYILHKSTPPQ